MKLTPFYILPLLLLGTACRSTSHRTYDERPAIADKTLMSVPVDDRDDINKERTALAEAQDRVTLAKADVDRAEERLDIAKKEVDVAETELDAAEERLELAYRGNEADREDRIENARERRDAIRAHMDWARTQVRLEEGRIEKAKTQVTVAERRVDLAEAKIELAKAKAVQDLKRPDLEPVDVRAFERSVADEELGLKLAEIDAEAADRKIELRQDLLDQRAEAVPASYRREWRRLDDPEKPKN